MLNNNNLTLKVYFKVFNTNHLNVPNLYINLQFSICSYKVLKMSVMIRSMLIGAMTPAIRRSPIMGYIVVKMCSQSNKPFNSYKK